MVAIDCAGALIIVTDAAAGTIRGLFIRVAAQITARDCNMRRVVPLRFRPRTALEAFQKIAERFFVLEEAVSAVAHALPLVSSSSSGAAGNRPPLGKPRASGNG